MPVTLRTGPNAQLRRDGRPVGHLLTALLVTAFVTFALATAGASAAENGHSGDAPLSKGYVEANGVNYYYEVHGTGEPLLLLHGGLGTMNMFDPILPELTASRQVIAVDLHGHGRTALGDRDLSLIAMGDDMAVILKELGYERVDVLGYSMGGGVGLRLAIQHPDMVGRLALIGTGYARDGFYPGILAQQAKVDSSMAKAMKKTPMYQAYVAVAPHPEDFPELLDQIGALMSKPYDWSEEIKQLKMPIMLVYGDSGMYRPEHIVSFYQLLGGGLRDGGWKGQHMSQNRLAILPGLTHYNIFFAPAMVRTVLPFLNGDMWSGSWMEQMERSH